jgi:hypothetical protein
VTDSDVTDERLSSYVSCPNQWDDDETVRGIYDDAQRMAAELQRRRAADLSEAERTALGRIRSDLREFGMFDAEADTEMHPDKLRAHIVVLDKLLGAKT